jgi:hypothetical protein
MPGGALGRGRAFVTPFRKRCTGSAGKRIGVQRRIELLDAGHSRICLPKLPHRRGQSGWNRTSITRSQAPGTTNIPRPDFVGPSSSSRTSLSCSSGRRCHRVSCRGIVRRRGFDPRSTVGKTVDLASGRAPRAARYFFCSACNGWSWRQESNPLRRAYNARAHHWASPASAPGVGFEPTMPFGAPLTAEWLTAHPTWNASRETAARLRAPSRRFELSKSSARVAPCGSGSWNRTNIHGFRDRRPTVRRSRSAPAGNRTLPFGLRNRCSTNELQAREKLREPGGIRTRAAWGKSPACRRNTSDPQSASPTFQPRVPFVIHCLHTSSV